MFDVYIAVALWCSMPDLTLGNSSAKVNLCRERLLECVSGKTPLQQRDCFKAEKL